MNDTYFLDRDGTPLGGKVPLQVFFHGSTAAIDLIRPPANGIVNAFLTDLRTSRLDSLRRTVELPGGSVSMEHAYGVTRVHVYAQSGDSDASRFFGGIVLQLQTIVDMEAYRIRATPELRQQRAVLPEVRSSGATAGATGRPAVPGTPANVEPEWVVVQIHPTRSLQDEPVRRGAVKIWRMHNPAFGDLVEVRRTDPLARPVTQKTYLVSTMAANAVNDRAVAPGSQFYVCGQVMKYVRPMPTVTWTSTHELMPVLPTRMYVVGLKVPSFEKAAKAEAIIFLAVGNSLYAYNTAERTNDNDPDQLAQWHVLASGTLAEGVWMNDFGTVIAFEQNPATKVITVAITGTNGAGACSELHATVTPSLLSSEPPTLAGFITTNTVTYTASVPEVFEGSRAESYTPTNVVTDTDSMEFGILDGGVSSVTRYVGYKATGVMATENDSMTFKSSMPAVAPDLFAGLTYTPNPREEIYSTKTHLENVVPSAFELTYKGQSLLHGHPGPLTSAIGWTPPIPVETDAYNLGLYQYGRWFGTTDPAYPPFSPYAEAGRNNCFEFSTLLTVTEIAGPAYSMSFTPGTSCGGHFAAISNGPHEEITEPPSLGDIANGTGTCIADYRMKSALVTRTYSAYQEIRSIGGVHPRTAVSSTTRFTVGHRLLTLLGNMHTPDQATRIEGTPESTLETTATSPFTAHTGEYGKDETFRFQYGAKDHHTGALAWRSDEGRAGAYSVGFRPGDVEQRSTWVFDGAGAYALDYALIEPIPDKPKRIDFPDFLSKFESVVDAGPLDYSTTGGLTSKVLEPYLTITREYSPNRTKLGAVIQIGFWGTSPDGSDYAEPYPPLKTNFAHLTQASSSTQPAEHPKRVENLTYFSRTEITEAETAGDRPNHFTLTTTTVGGAPFYTREDSYPPGAVLGLFARYRQPMARRVKEVLYRDLRTGGYVTQLHWTAVSEDDSLAKPLIETYIGNDSGAVPLHLVLAEWAAQGTGVVTTFADTLFDLPDTPAVALI